MAIRLIDGQTGEDVLSDNNSIPRWEAAKLASERKLAIEKIPREPEKFLVDFGGVRHPKLKDDEGNPIYITEFTPYQLEFWKHQGNILNVKGNKMGMTTSASLEDFHSRLMPEGAGYDVLLVAQSDFMAREHISELKRMIRNSPKYSKYLIERQDKFLMADQKSKISEAWIMNPYNPSQPSRIIGIGSTPKKAFSWKNINKIHMSDVSLLNNVDQSQFFAGLYSRLANTEGHVKIESIPNGQQGEVWNIYQKSALRIPQPSDESLADDPENISSMFEVVKTPTSMAVPYGIVSQKLLDSHRKEMGDLLYSQTYECNFLASGNQWYKPEWFTVGNYIL